jgi:antitoxin component of RelBE/YafQ-DinJ toxin-antitoxin module
METRIQFRVDEKTKRLAQQMAESQGRHLSDACRALTKQLAEEQIKLLTHGVWLTEQVNWAFEKFENEKSRFTEHEQAKAIMAERKAKIRKKA